MSDDTDDGMPDMLAGLRALQARAEAEDRALACHGATDRVEHCHATGARAACPRSRDRLCPWMEARESLHARAVELRGRGIPGADALAGTNGRPGKILRGEWHGPGRWPTLAELLIGTLPGIRKADGSACPPMPLRDTTALAMVRAFQARAPFAVEGRPIAFTGDEWCLIIGGEVDSGKSVAAGSVALDERCWFVGARELTTKSGGPDAWQEYELRMESARGCDFLILDDLGCEVDSEGGWATRELAALITERHKERLRTIITTNLRRAEIGARYAARVDSRLNEGAVFVPCKALNMRGAA